MKANLSEMLLAVAGFGTLFVVIFGVHAIFDMYGSIAGWLSVAAVGFFIAMYGKAYEAQKNESALRDKLSVVADALKKPDFE